MSKRRTVIHDTPTDTWSTCGIALPTSGTSNPAHVTCKRCIAMMMPYRREARDLTLNSRANERLTQT